MYKNRKTKNESSRTIAYCGMFIALAMVLSYIESLIPFGIAIPGVKLGLANIVTIIVLMKLGIKNALIVGIGRTVLSGLLFGNPITIIYSLVGTIISILLMWFVKKLKIFKITGISVVGAVFHNIGQLIVAAILIESTSIFYYMSILILSGTLAGVIIGILAGIIIKNINI